MALPTETTTLNNIAVAMWDSKLKDFITDNFFLVTPLIEKMLLNDKKNPGKVIRFQGGKQIDTTLLYNAPTTTSYGIGSTADTSITQIFTDAIFQWKQVWTPMNIDGLSLAKYAGGPETALFDFVEKLGEVSFESHAQKIDSMIFGDGTGNGGLDWDGLKEAVDDGTNYTTYGGITRSKGSTGTPGNAIIGYLNATAAPMSKATLEAADVQTSFNKFSVDLIITTRALWAKLWDCVEGADRNPPGPLRDVGFRTIRFNGAEVVFDDNVASGDVWGLNTQMMQLWFLSGNAFVRRAKQYGFANSGFPVANQDLTVDQLVSYGNFIVTGCRYNYQLQNVF